MNDADIDTAILKFVICQLVDAAFGGGGGGGGGSTSATTIAQGINQSTDIDAIVTALTSIDANQINQTSVRAAIDSSADIDTILARLLSIDSKTIVLADIVSAIQSAADIDTLIARLISIDNKTYPVGIGTIAQSQSVAIASDQRVPIDNQRINGTAIATGIGAADAGTQRVGLSSDSKISGYGYKSDATVQRAANTTAYAANDSYGDIFELQQFGSAGGHVILSGVRAIFNITSLPVGMGGFLLYLYAVNPPTVVTDNGAFSVPVLDRASLLTPGGIDLGSAVAAVGGGSVVLQADNLNIQIKLATGSTSVWGRLVTKSAFTPAANSETASISALTLGV